MADPKLAVVEAMSDGDVLERIAGGAVRSLLANKTFRLSIANALAAEVEAWRAGLETSATLREAADALAVDRAPASTSQRPARSAA